MESRVIVRDRYEVTDEDLNNMQAWAQQGVDNVVADTLIPGRKVTGFLVTEVSSTVVNVAAGRLYFDGKRYARNETDGVAISLVSVRPQFQNKVVAIVASPQEIETDEQERDFEVDAESEIYEPRAVKTEKRRVAALEAVPGPEAVAPQPPVIDTSSVIIALVTMSTDGIESVVMVTGNQVPNLEDMDDRLDSAEGLLDEVVPRISTIQSDLAKLDARTLEIGDKSIAYSVYEDLAEIKDRLNLTPAYVAYRKNLFLDEDQSDTDAATYSAKIEEGLRFAPDGIEEEQLQVFNAYDPNAKISGSGLLLPAGPSTVRRIVRGNAGTMSLAQYAYEARTLTVASMSRSRVRFGDEFEVSTGSAFYRGGTSYASGIGNKNTFAKDGEEYQEYDSKKVDPDGHRIVRLSKYWTDDVTQPYWKRLPTEVVNTGWAWCETFVQPQSGWCDGINPRIFAKPANGPITIGICGTYRGNPDYTNVLGMVTLNPGDIVDPSFYGLWAAAIEPIYLEAGQRYGMFLLTAADYVVSVGDAKAGAGGTLFYGVGGGVDYADPTRHIMFDLRYRVFSQSQTTIDLTPMSLNGGIASIDILADTIVPAGTDLRHEIQVSNVWTALDEMETSVLATLPPLVPHRLVFVGSQDLMPGIRLSGSRRRVSRPKTTLKHISESATLPAPSSKVTIKTKLRDFDPAHHTFTAKIDRAGNIETADTTTDIQRDARTIERVQVFNLAAPTSAYRSILEAGVDSASNLFVPTETFELAE